MITKIKSKKLWVIAIVLLAIGIALFLFRGNEDGWLKNKEGQWEKHGNPEIQDFDSCAKKYPVMLTYPAQCAIPDGPSFTQQ